MHGPRISIGPGCRLWPSRSWSGRSIGVGHRFAAVLTIVTGAAMGTAVMKSAAAPELDRMASARTLRLQLGSRQDTVCVWTGCRAGMQYSLDYYFVPPLPKCARASRPLWLHQLAGQLPVLGPPKSAP